MGQAKAWLNTLAFEGGLIHSASKEARGKLEGGSKEARRRLEGGSKEA